LDLCVYITGSGLGLCVSKQRLEIQLCPHKPISGFVLLSDRSKVIFGLGELCQSYVSYRLTQLLHTLLPTQPKGRLGQRVKYKLKYCCNA